MKILCHIFTYFKLNWFYWKGCFNLFTFSRQPLDQLECQKTKESSSKIHLCWSNTIFGCFFLSSWPLLSSRHSRHN